MTPNHLNPLDGYSDEALRRIEKVIRHDLATDPECENFANDLAAELQHRERDRRVEAQHLTNLNEDLL